MKKLIRILLVIIVLLCGGGYFVYIKADLVLAKIISRKATVPVTIKNIKFDTESFQIEEFHMSNPKGTCLPTALQIETIKVEAPYKTYFEDPIIIDQMLIDTVYINIQIYNKAQTKGNWPTIMNHLAAKHKNFFYHKAPTTIKKLILTNIQIDLILSDGKKHRLAPIDRLEFDNVNSEKGIPPEELSNIITKHLTPAIFLEKGLKSLIEAPVNIIKGVFPFL